MARDEDYRSEPLRAAEIERYRKDGFSLLARSLATVPSRNFGPVLWSWPHRPVLRVQSPRIFASGTSGQRIIHSICSFFTWRTLAFSPLLAEIAAQLLGTDKAVLFGTLLLLNRLRRADSCIGIRSTWRGLSTSLEDSPSGSSPRGESRQRIDDVRGGLAPAGRAAVGRWT